MKNSLWLLFFFTFASNTQCFAQLPDPNTGKDTTKIKIRNDALMAFDATAFIPKVIPPSPDAASLGRYGEIPVDLSRGSMSISIPLYEIQSGSLKMPVALNYHSGGVRVNDVSSSTGTSWSLSTSALTRAVNGLPDENALGFFNATMPSEVDNPAFLCYLGKVAELDGTRMDGQQDSYFYTFNGNSGRYVYPNKRRTVDQDLASLSAVTLPYKPIKIQGTKLTDVDGTIYSFGEDVNGQLSTERTLYTGDISYNFISTWYLSSVVSANRMDTILIDYTTAVSVHIPPLWSTTLVKKVEPSSTTTYSYQHGLAPAWIFSIYPANIYFKNGKVSFTYATDRLDAPEAKRLTGVYIYKKETSGAYTEIKHFELTHSYFNCTDGYSQTDASPTLIHTGSKLLKRLRLDAVTEKNPSGVALPAHQFTYYEDVALPIYGSYAQDFWGFYNGASSNQNLLIWDTNGSSEPSATYGANRLPSFAHAVAGALKEAKYPTSGKTRIEYEAHQNAAGIGGGGIRIKSISNMEGTSVLTKKSYAYPVDYITNNISTGNMAGLAYQVSLTQEEVKLCVKETNVYTSFPENYNFMLGSNSGSSMAYGTVEVTQTGVGSNTNGKTISIFSQATDWTSSMFPFISISNEWRRGQLLEEQHYNSAGTLIKATKNYYKTLLTDSLLRCLGAKTTFKPALGVFEGPFGNNCAFLANSYCPSGDTEGALFSTDAHLWTYQLLDHEIGAIFLDSAVTRTYDQAGANGLKEKSEFAYATATHHQILKQTVTDSKNLARETIYKYPHDFAPSNADYLEMVNRHIYSPVVEEENKVGGTFQSLVKTNYKKWYPSTNYQDVQGFFAPVSVHLQQAGGSLLPQIVFGEKLSSPTENGYDDKSHPVVFTERNGTVSRLTWWAEKGKHDLINTQSVNGLFSTTYDHNPLVGTRSVSDPDGKVTFYEYDPFNRLKNIRNDNASGGIRKSFCYNYAGQVTDCSLISSTTGKVSPSALVLIPVTTGGGPLPVTLISFTARAERNTALLNWKTASETNSERFDVERSVDAKSWTTIGRIAAQLESNTTQTYSFIDDKPLHGENLYRLKMVDRDGSFAKSKIEQLRFDMTSAVYPNPVAMEDKLHLNSKSVIAQVRITDMNGKVVHSIKNPGAEIDISRLATGVYLIQITTIDGAISIQRVLKR